MKEVRGTEKRKKAAWILSVALFAILFFPSLSHAAVVLQAPPNGGINDTFKWREKHPITGQARPHKGIDYKLGCGTRLTPPNGGSLNCPDNGGSSFSGIATAAHACGITERFIHLQSCNASSMISGGERGMRGAGGSTGCHLHYEILIDGTAVNPTSAYGKDLCDPATRKQLIDEAQQILKGQAGGGGGSTGTNPSTTPQPPAQPPPTQTPGPGGTITIYVPWTPDNPSGGYYEVVDINGHVINKIPAGGVNGNQVSLPPSIDDFVPTGDTDNQVTGCATDTWTAMVNQAVLQTRREMLFNQRFIAKGDTVMAYSCLADQFLLVGEHLGRGLSESQMWKNKQIDILGKTVTVNVDMGENTLDGAIVNVATEPYERFIRSNFDHAWLGGIAGGTGAAAGGDEDGISQDHALCGTMSYVWNMAKCLNMSDNPMFPRFEELIGNDPRVYPDGYVCNDSGITQKMIDTAKGKEVKFDKINAYINILYPEDGCYGPINTGVTVVRQKGAGQITTQTTYPDAVCITAGCSYQNSGGGNGSCVVQSP